MEKGWGRKCMRNFCCEKCQNRIRRCTFVCNMQISNMGFFNVCFVCILKWCAHRSLSAYCSATRRLSCAFASDTTLRITKNYMLQNCEWYTNRFKEQQERGTVMTLSDQPNPRYYCSHCWCCGCYSNTDATHYTSILLLLLSFGERIKLNYNKTNYYRRRRWVLGVLVCCAKCFCWVFAWSSELLSGACVSIDWLRLNIKRLVAAYETYLHPIWSIVCWPDVRHCDNGNQMTM